MLNDLERKRAERTLAPLLRRRLSSHVKDGGRIAYRFSGHWIELFSVRPAWDDPNELIELPIAKFRYIRVREEWSLFWNRQSGKWRTYQPLPTAERLETLVDEVLADPHACFWG